LARSRPTECMPNLPMRRHHVVSLYARADLPRRCMESIWQTIVSHGTLSIHIDELICCACQKKRTPRRRSTRPPAALGQHQCDERAHFYFAWGCFAIYVLACGAPKRPMRSKTRVERALWGRHAAPGTTRSCPAEKVPISNGSRRILPFGYLLHPLA